MIRLAVRELLSRRTATLLTGAALLTATLTFVVLAGTATSTQAVLNGDIGRAWDTPYDLLIRPTGSRTELEQARGLIRPNYVSGLLGGITRTQLEAIRSIPGVETAAPIAMVGFVEWPSAYLQDLPASDAAATTVYRVSAATDGDSGLSRYPVEKRYVVVSPKSDLQFDPQGGRLQLRGGGTVDCAYPVNCFAGRVCSFGECRTGAFPSTRDARYYLPLLQPIVIAGIDPVAEARIAGLDRCLTSGRFLSAEDKPVASAQEEDPPTERIPVLVSDRSFDDQVLSIRIERARSPAALTRGAAPDQLRSWIPVSRTSATLASLYADFLPSVHDYLDPWPIWSAGDVSYAEAEPGPGRAPALRALDRPGRPSIYQGSTSSEFGIPDELLIPPEDADPWFRGVTEHADRYEPRPGTDYRFKLWNEVGRYDPTCLPGFDSLTGGNLETYSLPEVRLSDGSALGPTRSMAGYVNSPPLLLTTLDGAAWLADRKRYRGEAGQAFISSIRVRVIGARTPGPEAEARLENVATRIHEETGLQVDIAKGASTRSVHIELPAGRFGRPVLDVTEAWWAKGVAIRFVAAVRTQDVVLFSMVLVGAAVLVAESAFVSVRRRRSEFGVLRALGWPLWRIAGLVEAEMILLGLAAGVIGALSALLLRMTVLAALPVGLVLLSVVLATVIGGVAGLVPAVAAARGSAISVISGSGPIRRSRAPFSAATLGLRQMRRERRLEALLGIAAVALGAALLGGVVLAAGAFRDRLDVTTLGSFLGSEVHPFHVAIAAMALAFGAIAAGEIVVLGYIEREREFGVMRAVGWPRSRVLAMLGAQGVAMGLLGGLLGGLLVLAGGSVAGEPSEAVLRGAVSGALVAAVATAVAVAGSMILVYRASPARALRGE